MYPRNRHSTELHYIDNDIFLHRRYSIITDKKIDIELHSTKCVVVHTQTTDDGGFSKMYH